MLKEKAELARALIESKAIKFGAFKLALHDKHRTAPLSPIYLNLRTAQHPDPEKRGPLTPEIMNMIGDQFERLSLKHFDRFTDLPDAGKPFGDQFERVANHVDGTTRLVLHKVPGTRDIADMIDGTYNHGDVCLLVDDLITQADSKLRAIHVLQRNGLNVEEVLVLVDRQQGGARQLEAHGYHLQAVFRLDELLDFYVETGLLGEMKAEEVRRYIAANQVQ